MCLDRCVAVRCSMLQCVAVCCCVLQCVAGTINVSRTAFESVLHCVAVFLFICISLHSSESVSSGICRSLP